MGKRVIRRLKVNRYEGNGIGLETLSSARNAPALADEVLVGNRTGLAVRV